MPIQILPPQLANQIAAGEVVERPASIVKELLENALDAGATRIEIEVDKGGHKRIFIRDNGHGIAKDDLGLALSRHATSKISTLEDLENILSMGFRGEALASISSVSRLYLSSNTEGQQEGWKAISEGRDMDLSLSPCAHPIGTTVEVLDLFHNTPARRKFLRTEKTEFSHIEDVVKRIALSRFDVQFSLKHNGKQLRYFPIANNQTQKLKRVKLISGARFTDNCVWLESECDDVKLSGWIANPDACRASNDGQFSFINGRVMRDKLVNHAIREACEGLIDRDLYPAFVLYLEMPANQVDVNVHPAKHEVRFREARRIHDFIYASVTDAMSQANDMVERPVVTEPKHDYIVPLSQEPRYETQISDNGSSLSQNRSQSRNSASMSEYSAVETPIAAANYAQLMQTGNTSELALLFLGEKGFITYLNEQLYFVSAQEIMQQWLCNVLSRDGLVRQPLLMPISVVNTAQLDRTKLSQLADKAFEFNLTPQKLILKSVPAELRKVQWLKVIPDFLQNVDDYSDVVISLIRAVSMHWHFEQGETVGTYWNQICLTMDNQNDWIQKRGRLMPMQAWLKAQTEYAQNDQQ